MADLENKEQRIIEATEKLEADIIDFASRLVAEPSTLGDEASALAVMETELKQLVEAAVATQCLVQGFTAHHREAHHGPAPDGQWLRGITQ